MMRVLRSRNNNGNWRAPCAVLAVMVLWPSVASANPARVAVMGDSISAGSGVTGGSPNWVAQLGSTFPSAITFQNEAVGGVTTNTMVATQLPTVVNLAKNGQIDDSVVQIGANDLSISDAVTFANGGSPTAFINSYVNDIKTVVNSLAAANPNVHQVFVNNGDPASSPYFVQNATAAGITSAGLQIVSGVIAQEDALADAYCLANNVAVVNSFAAGDALNAAVPFTLAGHTFTTAFAPDGHHPAPFVQGLLANAIDSGLNATFGQGLPILSDQQIVQNVGFTPTGGTTYYNVLPYVLVPVPGDTTGDGIVNGQDIALVASNWLSVGTNSPGDANHDGLVNGQDIALIAANWLHTSGSGAGGGAVVPEPSGIALATLGFAALTLGRLWRRMGLAHRP